MQNEIFSKIVRLSFSSKTIIRLDENNEVVFTPTPNGYCFKFNVEILKGAADIQKIINIFTDNRRLDKNYDPVTKSFICGNYNNAGFEIKYSVPIEYKSVDYIEVVHHFQFSANLIQVLNFDEFYEKEIVLPGYENMLFKYGITKTKTGHGKLSIKNYDGCFIECTKGDFEYQVGQYDGFNKNISFIFDPRISNEISQTPVFDESRPESVILQTSETKASRFYEIMSDTKYSDVTLISSDNIEIPSHRCVLAKYSNVFDSMFEASENSTRITIDEFNAETVKAALDILYGKTDAIVGKEIEVFKFCVKYVIQELIDACTSHFVDSVNPLNVCEYIQIAYTNHLKELKQKCKQILVEKKAEIDFTKFADLSKDILFDVYCR